MPDKGKSKGTTSKPAAKSNKSNAKSDNKKGTPAKPAKKK